MKGLFILIFLILIKFCTAQVPHTFFQLFLDKGLSDARVNAIVQDRYGFMWFGTRNGLNRYDGYSIKAYYADTSGRQLTSNLILSLYSDSKGLLWVGTASGLLQYRFADDRFERVSIFDSLGADRITCITEDEVGNLFVAGAKGLFKWNRLNNSWTNVSAALGLADRMTRIRGLHFFDEKTLYVTSENMGFYKVNVTDLKAEAIPFKARYADTCCLYMIGMQRLNDSSMLIGTLSHGLVGFNVHTKKFYEIDGAITQNENIRYNTTYEILKDKSGRFWIASFYFGLGEYLPDKQKTISIAAEPNNPLGFDGSTALCLYQDRQGNIWIGTATKGIYRFNPGRQTVRFYGQDEARPNALQRSHVISMAGLDSNTLMIGTEAGPSFYDRRTHMFTNYKGMGRDLKTRPLEFVQCGVMDPKGIVWMGTYRLGLMRYDPAVKSFTVISRFSKPYGLEEDGITQVLPCKGDSLMLIGWNRIATLNTHTFKSTSRFHDTLPLYLLRDVVSICYNRSKTFIWIATSAGKLYQYRLETKLLTDESALFKSLNETPVINKIAVDKMDRLWCATNLGAVMLAEGREAALYRFSHNKNIAGEVKSILPYKQYVWMTNNRILARMNPVNGNTSYFGEREGIVNMQLFGSSLTLSPWNTVLIGCNQGFYEIFPEKLKDEEPAMPAYLTDFRVFNNPYTTPDLVSTLSVIKLKHWENSFSFDMSAFDYAAGNDMEYAYKLEGFDKDWQYINQNRSVSYTNVPGGKYTLFIKSRIANGEWNENGQRLRIEVAIPFWRSWWFISLCTLSIAFSIYGWYRLRITRIREEERVKRELQVKLNDLENSALRTQMSPHFIFNSLNTINSFINRNDAAKANQYISKFAHLIRMILDHSREKKISIADELNVLDLYIQLERIRFDNKFNYSIVTDEHIDTDAAEIPPLIIQPFVENAILHGLLPLQHEGNLNISLHVAGEHLLCRIEDNGIGRKQAQLKNQHTAGKRKSHGLDITIKRIELFNEEYGLNEAVKITDLEDAESHSVGTRVDIPLALVDRF